MISDQAWREIMMLTATAEQMFREGGYMLQRRRMVVGACFEAGHAKDRMVREVSRVGGCQIRVKWLLKSDLKSGRFVSGIEGRTAGQECSMSWTEQRWMRNECRTRGKEGSV